MSLISFLVISEIDNLSNDIGKKINMSAEIRIL